MKQRRLLNFCLALALAAVLSVQAFAAVPAELVPVGAAVGIQIKTDGIVITGFDEHAPAREAGLRTGDVIRCVDGTAVEQAADLAAAVRQSGGRSLTISALRKGKSVEVAVTPEAKEGGWQMGIYIRDSIAGIGTVTFYDPRTGAYGALGHGISDGGSTQLLPLADGELIRAEVVGVNRGQKGKPGQLQGSFDTEDPIGTVERNTNAGIFGDLELDCDDELLLPVAAPSEIKVGAAKIRCMVCGDEICEYDVKIEKVCAEDVYSGRNMIVKVTDPVLLKTTGGIVQGMSGSPIIQDGKLVGAVTHVLVNDPTTGYGIFIENMLDAAA